MQRRRGLFRRSSKRRGQLARHADVRHRVDAVRGDLEIEDRVVAVLLRRLDGVADLRQADAELVIAEIGEIDVIVEPSRENFIGAAIVTEPA